MYIFHFRSEKQELRKQIATMASKVAKGVQDQQDYHNPADCDCACDVRSNPVWNESFDAITVEEPLNEYCLLLWPSS